MQVLTFFRPLVIEDSSPDFFLKREEIEKKNQNRIGKIWQRSIFFFKSQIFTSTKLRMALIGVTAIIIPYALIQKKVSLSIIAIGIFAVSVVSLIQFLRLRYKTRKIKVNQIKQSEEIVKLIKRLDTLININNDGLPLKEIKQIGKSINSLLSPIDNPHPLTMLMPEKTQQLKTYLYMQLKGIVVLKDGALLLATQSCKEKIKEFTDSYDYLRKNYDLKPLDVS